MAELVNEGFADLSGWTGPLAGAWSEDSED